MYRRIPMVVLFLLLSLPTAWGQGQVPPEPDGMRPIFNGKDLTGWDGDPRLWTVRDGAIHGETTAEEPAHGNTFLIWKGGRTRDFDLRLSFRCTAANNSGIQYRSRRLPEGKGVKNRWVVYGYQYELRNENRFPTVSGYIYDEGGKRGRMCMVGEKATWGEEGKRLQETFLDEAQFQELFKLDRWNDVAIVARGNHIRHYLNGKLVMDFTDNHPKLALHDGILALQLHAGKPMWVEFKNLRIKVLEEK